MRITKGKTKLLSSWMHLRLYLTSIQRNTVKPVYRGHSREPENVDFISSCPLYRLQLYAIFINRKNETALYRQ